MLFNLAGHQNEIIGLQSDPAAHGRSGGSSTNTNCPPPSERRPATLPNICSFPRHPDVDLLLGHAGLVKQIRPPCHELSFPFVRDNAPLFWSVRVSVRRLLLVPLVRAPAKEGVVPISHQKHGSHLTGFRGGDRDAELRVYLLADTDDPDGQQFLACSRVRFFVRSEA